jgi:hypothetical protein
MYFYLNGSVQKTDNLERERRLVLTARLSSMGSSGGTTLVRMSVHSRNSLYRFLQLQKYPRLSQKKNSVFNSHYRKKKMTKVPINLCVYRKGP